VKRVIYSASVLKCTDVCKHRFGVQLLKNPPLCSSTYYTSFKGYFQTWRLPRRWISVLCPCHSETLSGSTESLKGHNSGGPGPGAAFSAPEQYHRPLCPPRYIGGDNESHTLSGHTLTRGYNHFHPFWLLMAARTAAPPSSDSTRDKKDTQTDSPKS
jgi:hypothetical protein